MECISHFLVYFKGCRKSFLDWPSVYVFYYRRLCVFLYLTYSYQTDKNNNANLLISMLVRIQSFGFKSNQILSRSSLLQFHCLMIKNDLSRPIQFSIPIFINWGDSYLNLIVLGAAYFFHLKMISTNWWQLSLRLLNNPSSMLHRC